MENVAEHASGAVGERSAFTEEQLAQLRAAHDLAIQQAVSQAVGTLTEELRERDSRVRVLEQLLTTQTANFPLRPRSNHTGHEALGKLTGKKIENSYFQCGLCIGGSCCSKRTDVTEIGNTRQLGTPCDTNIQQDMIQKACLCTGFHSISYSTCIRVNN